MWGSGGNGHRASDSRGHTAFTWNDDRMTSQAAAPTGSRWRIETLDILAASATAILGYAWVVGVASVLGYASYNPTGALLAAMLITALMAGAVLLARGHGGWALLLVWAACLLQVVSIQVIPAQVAVVWVAYATARHGSRETLIVSGVSAPLGTLAALLWVASGSLDLGSFLPDVWWSLPNDGARWLLVGLASILPVMLPWVIGFVGRLRNARKVADWERASAVAAQQQAEAQRAAAEAEQARAERVAAQESGQARLARDVHDVVGHSLAVILAQAESAQFLDDPARLHETLANVAMAARRSLGEVRDVLGAAREDSAPAAPGAIEELLDAVRATGADVRATVTGTPRPLPPELETVAYRVMQEMLTNALRHGDRSHPVTVDRAWEDRLRLRVRNVAAAPVPDGSRDPLSGVGLPGIRARVASVGGDFDFERTPGPDGDVVSATAWLPLGVSPARTDAAHAEAITAPMSVANPAASGRNSQPTQPIPTAVTETVPTEFTRPAPTPFQESP